MTQEKKLVLRPLSEHLLDYIREHGGVLQIRWEMDYGG